MGALWVIVCCSVHGQHTDSVTYAQLYPELDSLFSLEDSLSIFDMIDSILQMEEPSLSSQLAARVTFNSNVGSAGRTLNINQFGLSGGLSYYHKGGAYLDLAGYWSNEFDPQNYYLTILTGGYLFSLSKAWSGLIEYNKYFYSQQSGEDIANIPYTHSAGLSNFVRVKPLMLRLDYYFYFGDRNAHRILPGLSLNLEKRNWIGLDRILLFPSFTMLMGDETVLDYSPLFNTRLGAFLRLRAGLPLYEEVENKVFGIMNYSLSLPLSIQAGNWNFFVSYVYNIPKALPGEELELENSGYLSAGITKYFNLR